MYTALAFDLDCMIEQVKMVNLVFLNPSQDSTEKQMLRNLQLKRTFI